jgi:hypothetical protein
MKMKTKSIGTYGTQQSSPVTGKFIAMSAYIKKTERSQINDLIIHLKLLDKQEQANPKTNRRDNNKNNS